MIAPSNLHAIGAELTTETDDSGDGFERLQQVCEELAGLWDVDAEKAAAEVAAAVGRTVTFLRLQREFDIRHR
jgi:hypothetical protein